MLIRWARPADVSAIQVVARESWLANYGFVNRDELEAAVHEWYAWETLHRELANPDALILVAEVGGIVVGFCHVRADFQKERGDVLRLYVHPSYRSRGIGSALFEEAVDTLREDGVTRLWATALTANPAGTDFYDDLGFTLVAKEWTALGARFYQENTYAKDIDEEPEEELQPDQERAPG